MTLHGFYTNKGRALAAKITAGTAEMTVTRVVDGDGHTADIPSATDLPSQKQTLHIGLPSVSDMTAVLPITLLEAEAASSYGLTELGVYAIDPDAGEILFQVYQLTEAMDITAGGEGVLRFYLRQSIGAADVSVICSPAGVVLEEDIAELRARDAFADHRNLLDNPWFTVNQRGQSSYTGSAGYCVDRWYKHNDASITVGASGLIFADGTNNNLILQTIEEDLSGLKITMSAIVDGVLYSGQKVVDQYDYTSRVNFPEGSIRVRVHNGHTQFMVWFDSTNEHTVSAVKLELGEVSTLANDTAPDYGTELAKCQRYYREFSPMFSLGMNHGGMIAFRYATSPQMRALPTITMENGNNLTDCLDNGDSPATPSAVTLNWWTRADSIGFYFSGVPTDKSYTCGRKIYASADL